MAGHIPTALSCEWCTPDETCEDIRDVFGRPPDLDPCSNPYSHVGAKVEYTLENGNDGLVDPWTGQNIFFNPPFGKGWWKPLAHTDECLQRPNTALVCSCQNVRKYIWPKDREKMSKAELKPYKLVTIADWIKRGHDAGLGPDGKNVIGLIPSYPDTKAWKNHVWKATRVFFPEGRLHFRLVYTLDDGSIFEKTGPAPMACALPLWTNDLYLVNEFERVFSKKGKVITP